MIKYIHDEEYVLIDCYMDIWSLTIEIRGFHVSSTDFDCSWF